MSVPSPTQNPPMRSDADSVAVSASGIGSGAATAAAEDPAAVVLPLLLPARTEWGHSLHQMRQQSIVGGGSAAGAEGEGDAHDDEEGDAAAPPTQPIGVRVMFLSPFDVLVLPKPSSQTAREQKEEEERLRRRDVRHRRLVFMRGGGGGDGGGQQQSLSGSEVFAPSPNEPMPAPPTLPLSSGAGGEGSEVPSGNGNGVNGGKMVPRPPSSQPPPPPILRQPSVPTPNSNNSNSRTSVKLACASNYYYLPSRLWAGSRNCVGVDVEKIGDKGGMRDKGGIGAETSSSSLPSLPPLSSPSPSSPSPLTTFKPIVSLHVMDWLTATSHDVLLAALTVMTLDTKGLEAYRRASSLASSSSSSLAFAIDGVVQANTASSSYPSPLSRLHLGMVSDRFVADDSEAEEEDRRNDDDDEEEEEAVVGSAEGVAAEGKKSCSKATVLLKKKRRRIRIVDSLVALPSSSSSQQGTPSPSIASMSPQLLSTFMRKGDTVAIILEFNDGVSKAN